MGCLLDFGPFGRPFLPRNFQGIKSAKIFIRNIFCRDAKVGQIFRNATASEGAQWRGEGVGGGCPIRHFLILIILLNRWPSPHIAQGRPLR